MLSKKYWHQNRENVNKFKYFCAENGGETQLPSSTSIGGKKQGFGVPQNLEDLDPQNDRFFVFGNWFKTIKCAEFSVHFTLIMKAESWILQKHNTKIKFRKARKTRKVCVWTEPKIIDFSSKSGKTELKLLTLERSNVAEDSDKNHRKWTKNARIEYQYF